MASYNDMARTVLDFYTNPDQLVQYGGWEKVFDPNNTYSLEQAYEAIRNNPNIQIIERADGTVVGWWNKSTGSGSIVSDVGSLPNSNIAGGSVNSSASVNINTAPVITQVPGSTNFKIANAPAVGEKWATNGGVLGAALVVASGIKLGVTIDAALYKAFPDVFEDTKLGSFNPDRWKEIGTVVNEQWTEMGYPTIGKIGQMVFDTITYVGQDGSSQQYIDENAFTYAAQYLYENGFFGKAAPAVGTKLSYVSLVPYSSLNNNLTGEMREIYDNLVSSVPRGYTIAYYSGNSNFDTSYIQEVFAVNNSKLDKYTFVDNGNGLSEGTAKAIFHSQFYRWVYKTEYVSQIGGRFILGTVLPPNRPIGYGLMPVSTTIAGVGTQSGATLPDFSTATDFDSFKTLLKQQYPDMWDGAVTRDVLQPDGTLKTFTYVPVPTPNTKGWTDTQPTGDGSQQSQKDTVVNPDMDTSIKDTISSSGSTGSTTPNPPDTGGGDSPTVVPPVGKASSLWSIYNPTLEQVNQFGSWLWSSDFVEQLKKLFSDPMQAIIGLHKVYSPVQTTGQGTIKCGYLDSGVPSKLVSEQYVTVDCGSVDMQEYFGNVFDYSPYTEISIYLPFIGIRQLDPSDVMRSTISVKYHIDVLTGACLAEVNVQRDASGGTLYTFSGDAAVQYPVSSGSYMGIVSGLVGVATSLVSGNMLPALGGATRLHTNVERSGSFTGNSGAMGSKVPYIIISRPQTAMANKFETLSGYPSNTYTPLSACKGFTQVKYCHVENLYATETEKNEIERMLKEGVIL